MRPDRAWCPALPPGRAEQSPDGQQTARRPPERQRRTTWPRLARHRAACCFGTAPSVYLSPGWQEEISAPEYRNCHLIRSLHETDLVWPRTYIAMGDSISEQPDMQR